MRVAYFVHDLNDAGVARRIRMLHGGGLDVVAAGFWRSAAPPEQIDGAPVVPLAQSFDARLAGRAMATIGQSLRPQTLRSRLGSADLMLARNLEMLAIASRVAGGSVPVVYEVLDVHRLLTGRSVASRVLRRIEAALMQRAELLLTSSPGFLRAYFHNPKFARPRLPTLVLENKLLDLGGEIAGGERREPLPVGPPWIIGWFGMLRCRRSLEMLARIARQRPDLVRVRIFGRPAPPVRARLAELARVIPGLEFGGAYRACDLGRLYARIHFTWAIDYFEEGANSEWLLPNRIYEGGSADAVPIALGHTETGRWLKERGLGVLFEEPQSELEIFLATRAPLAYHDLKRAALSAPRAYFVAGNADCAALAGALVQAARDRSPQKAAALRPKAAA